jgi:ribosome-associated toxin RatA of RatAB toxin-antitoxin module
MRSIRLDALVPTEDTALVFKKIIDFGRYPGIAADVRAVEVRPSAESVRRSDWAQHSDWEVNFRRGIMRWTEREEIFPDRLHVDFTQTDGDFAEFHGTWQLTPVADGCRAELKVTYDFGIESLAGLMDPLAERVIKRAICIVLADVVGSVEIRGGGEALTDLGEFPPESGIHVRTSRSAEEATDGRSQPV